MLFVIGANGGLGNGLLESFRSKAISGQPSPFGFVVGLTRSDMDLERPESIRDYWTRVEKDLAPGEPLYVINAAGCSLNGVCHKLSLEDWNKTLSINLTSNFLLLQTLQPLLKTRPGSSVLLFSSIVANTGVPGTIAYAASKSGIRGMVRTAAKELARFGVTVNCVELGYFDRGMIKQVPNEHLDKLKSEIPLGRLGNIEDLLQTCTYALSCRYFTGSVLGLNGGLF